MTILVISDSHGWTDELKTIIDQHRHSVDTIVHAGDSELNEDAIELSGVQVVAGNCDYIASFPDELEVSLGNDKVFVTHGHLDGVKQSLQVLAKKAKQKGLSIVVYGHTHVAKAEMINDVVLINPGSIRLPKGKHSGSYCFIERNANKLTVTYYSVDGTLISELSNEFNL